MVKHLNHNDRKLDFQVTSEQCWTVKLLIIFPFYSRLKIKDKKYKFWIVNLNIQYSKWIADNHKHVCKWRTHWISVSMEYWILTLTLVNIKCICYYYCLLILRERCTYRKCIKTIECFETSVCAIAHLDTNSQSKSEIIEIQNLFWNCNKIMIKINKQLR